jgi:hypothetical protein
VKRPAWDFWAPLAVVAIGLYRLATGDVVLSLLAISIGLMCFGAGLLARRRS